MCGGHFVNTGCVPVFCGNRESSLRPPDIPIVSTLTGDWLKADEATDFLYWSRHLREAVRFSPAIQQVLSRHPAAAFLEMGPRAMLSTLVRQHAPRGSVPTFAIASLADSPANELQQMGLAQGGLWTAGIELPAPVASPPEGRRRVALPAMLSSVPGIGSTPHLP